MFKRTQNRWLVLIFIIAGASSVFPGSNTTITDIKNNLICSCTCAMTVEACEGSMACGEASKLTAEIRKLMDAGLEREMILASFVSRYGEQILAAPTKKGFNLLAWIMPFAAILVAGFGIVILLRRWASTTANLKMERIPVGDSERIPGKYEEILDGVLQDLD